MTHHRHHPLEDGNTDDLPHGTPMLRVTCEQRFCGATYTFGAPGITDPDARTREAAAVLTRDTDWRAVLTNNGTLRAWCPATDPADPELLTAELRAIADTTARALTYTDPWRHDMLTARAAALAGLATLATRTRA